GGRSHETQDVYSAGQLLHEQGERNGYHDPLQAFTYGQQSMAQDAFKDGARQYMKRNEQGKMEARALEPAKPGTAAGQAGKFAEGYESAYVDFLNAVMHPDPLQRLSPSRALQHPFMTQAVLEEEEVKKVLERMQEA